VIKTQKNIHVNSEPFFDFSNYLRLVGVGRLLYITITGFDVYNVVQYRSQFVASRLMVRHQDPIKVIRHEWYSS